MPTYDYRCQKCGHALEVSQKITDAPIELCPVCDSLSLRRGPGGGSGIQFKGKDFYYNDYGPGKEHQKKEGCCPCGKPESGCGSSA